MLSVVCGLDTRPWRLEPAPDLRWIEIDFADVPDDKDRLMAGDRSRGRRERLTVDLNNAAQRHAMYEAAGSSSALMIIEGVLVYLPAGTVDALAAEAISTVWVLCSNACGARWAALCRRGCRIVSPGRSDGVRFAQK